MCVQTGDSAPDDHRENHPLLVLDNEIICACCGNSIKQNGLAEIPGNVVCILRTLIQKGLMQASSGIETGTPVLRHHKPKSDVHTIMLSRKDAGGAELACKVQWTYVERDSTAEQSRKKSKYCRQSVGCYIPESVHQVVSIISDSDGGGWNSMNVMFIDIKGKRKIIRLERNAVLVNDCNKADSYTSLLMRFEIAWTLPEEEMTLYVPILNLQTADMLMKIPISQWHTFETKETEFWHQFIWPSWGQLNRAIEYRGPIEICLSREDALDPLCNRGLVVEHKQLINGCYLLCINRCNAYAVTAAVVADYAAFLEARPNLKSVAGVEPIILPPPDEIGRAQLGPALQQALSQVRPRDIKLEYVPGA
jgi:hypothetical protein